MPKVLSLEKSGKQQRNKTSYDIVNNKSNKKVLKKLVVYVFLLKIFFFFNLLNTEKINHKRRRKIRNSHSQKSNIKRVQTTTNNVPALEANMGAYTH